MTMVPFQEPTEDKSSRIFGDACGNGHQAYQNLQLCEYIVGTTITSGQPVVSTV